MPHVTMRRTALLFTALAGLCLSRGLPASAAAAEADGIRVEHAWARASAGVPTTGAAYVTLNGGAQPDALVSVTTPVAASAEVHESFTDNTVMKMRAVPSLPIPAKKVVTLAPGSYHVMLMGLKQPLVAGQSFPLTLTFAHAAPVTVDVTVQGLGHAGPMQGHEMHMQ